MNEYTHICHESCHDLPSIGDCVIQVNMFGNVTIKRVKSCSQVHFTSWTGNYLYLTLENYHQLWNNLVENTQNKLFESLNHVEELENPITIGDE